MPKKPKKERQKPKKSLVDIGAQNVKNWAFLKDKLNFKNDEDFVEYLLSVAEKYLCSKLLQFETKPKPSKDSSDEEEDKAQPTEREEVDVEDTENILTLNNNLEKPSVIISNKAGNCDTKIRKAKSKEVEREKRPKEPLKQKIPNESSDAKEEDEKEERTKNTGVKICCFCDTRHPPDACPLQKPVSRIADKAVYEQGLEGEDCAKATLPEGLELREVEGGNLAVFTITQFAQYSQFGPLVGPRIKEMEIADDYSMKHIWEVGQDFYISTSSPEKSNWLRWLRPAPTRSDRNVVPVEKNGQLFFITLVPIPSDVELIFWAEMTGSWASKKMEKTSCGGCNLQFEHAMYYRMHCAVFHEASLSLTVRKYHCKVCGKAVLGKQNIMKHALLYHEGKGAYQCQFCSKFFLRLNYLEMHRNYGCSANPHRARPLCDYCGRKFCQPQKLKVHIKRMHSDLSEVLREFQCADCLKVLGSRAALQRHTKEVHKRPSGVSCARCSKTFQNKSNLKIHMLTHSGVKPFKCQEDKCTAAFTTKQCLQFHYKKVHGLTEDRFPRIVRSVEYTFESYAGQKDNEDDSNREDSLSSEASLIRNNENTTEEVIQEVQESENVREPTPPVDVVEHTPTCEETSVIEYHPSILSKGSKKYMGDYHQEDYPEEPKIYRRPESSTASLLVEAAIDAAEKDLRPEFVEMTSPRSPPPYRSPAPMYASPRYERQYLTPPHDFVHDEQRYREEEMVQNLSKYKYEDEVNREIYHGFMPRYTMYEYPPEVIRAMNMQSVDLSMPRGQLIPPVVTHIEDRIVSPPYQPFSQAYIPQKSPPYHHYSGYY